METASLSEIKKELKELSPQQLQDIIARLARFKKENKELLHYLLFEAVDEQVFIQNVKEEIDEQFRHLNRSTGYLAKKTVRKTLQTTNKYIRFSGSKETEMELLLYFCAKMKKLGIRTGFGRTISNLYQRQVQRIQKVWSSLHGDLQYDYRGAIDNL
jgi:hypothetical protein